jgi:hypothetical protein
MTGNLAGPESIKIDPHFSPQFYAELWSMSQSTVVRWFQDMEGVLKLAKPSRTRNEPESSCGLPFRSRCG